VTARTDRDRVRMEEALALAREGEGLTRPNPPVGAVVVKGGRVVGRGFHRRAGTAHAEVAALRDAGPAARGAELYVTLEPCSTRGRTPPCTDAILQAGITRVVVGARDPNPAHQGAGLRVLNAAGVEVLEGVCGPDADRLIDPFRTWIQSGRPRVTLKLAMTLDGRIADRHGASRWITGATSRELVQAWRRRSDAIMVGARTLRRDDPSLLPRPARGRRPWRVVVAGAGPLPRGAQVLTDRAAARTLVACGARVPRLPPGCRAEVLSLPAGRSGRVSLPRLMRELAARGILHVLCEGGGRLAESLAKAGLVDAYLLFYGPSLLGGSAVPAWEGTGWRMASRPALTIDAVERIGEDVLVSAHPGSATSQEEQPCSPG
jgi:diaminohydroxyphosphoribosylaminopyrimidine deaminase / 5-amino-6-(5-phosphoribosylamino)uracil reductase